MAGFVGKTVGQILVLHLASSPIPEKTTRVWYQCRCRCGKEWPVRGDRLHWIKSCGCSHRTRHGLARSKTYQSYAHIKNKAYRGVEQVEECWMLGFENFLRDMGEKPDGKVLMRINRNKPYGPDNCKWATWSELNTNKYKPRKTAE